MRNHNNGLFFRLDDADYAKLKLMAHSSRLPMSTVLRKLIDDESIIAYPPVDYWNLFRSIEKCRNKLDSKDLLNPQCHICTECKKALAECTAAWRAVMDAFFKPDYNRSSEESEVCDTYERTDANGNGKEKNV